MCWYKDGIIREDGMSSQPFMTTLTMKSDRDFSCPLSLVRVCSTRSGRNSTPGLATSVSRPSFLRGAPLLAAQKPRVHLC